MATRDTRHAQWPDRWPSRPSHAPPFALNSVRKLAAAYAPGIDLLQAAHRLLDPPAWHALAQRAQAAIEADIETAQAEGPAAAARSQRLSSALCQLQAHMPEAPGKETP
ncbi:hypothetical protein M5C97_14520 [Acidovorax sp. NCPPB 3859]|nr:MULTISPECIES: hypothetical protein [unclassified Acidovorax]MDA8452709.1 hypothetical protein [Acidovorax sp. GBBC 3297]MDA8462116.1 hypothetical protein [Acidovorax sp. GBBC 3333]MDA8467177.1 hypothetical protein [Acidovorax sp. GBBC 3332]MDA8472212.1 hypothetical protein [Acidovorax sp. GBBC 3299]WCM76737.1 hypothetical protein M5C94_14475 [Acidovorax sp. GBBC 712]